MPGSVERHNEVRAFVEAVSKEWMERAGDFRRYGSGQLADATQVLAAELLAKAIEYCQEPLSLGRAASESGYSRAHLSRLIRSGRLPNAGRKGRPEIRRQDLPAKPGLATPIPRVQLHEASRQQVARFLIRKRG